MHRNSLLAGILIAVGTAMAFVWMLMLPMFLAPDEDTHYDYALTLYSAGRPIKASEDRVGRDTHPVVEYLMNATHARQQRLDRNVGADPGYGTLEYFRTLDRLAPRVSRAAFHDSAIDPAPYISKVYPIGYYALVAAAVAVTTGMSHGSAVASFFTARFLSVLLFAPTLLLTWLSFRKLTLSPKTALIVLACIALLPLSHWTAATIQPDNLAYFFVAGSLYVALRLRDNLESVALQALLGLLLGALITVKQHYFAAVFLATAAMLAPRLDFRRHALAAARCVALLTALPLASFLATRSFLTPAASGVCHFNSAISELHGPVAGLRLFSYGLLQAFANTFLDESGLESFWLYFTAYRNSPITIMTPAFTALLLVIISALSVIVLMLFLARLTQTARRLALVAEHRCLRSALRVATSNLLINSYIVFFFIIYGFEMMVGGYIPLQGRYWLPFVAGLWIITIESAPRALPKRFRRIFARGLSKALLLTIIVAAACSLPSLYSRFYANSAPLSPPDETAADMRVLRIGDTFRFSGYAVDRRDASPATQTALRLDHKSVLDTRPAASPRLECDTERTLSNAGFEAQLPSSDLTPGRHSVAVLVKVPWSARLLDTGVTARFAVPPGTVPKRSMAGNL